MERKKNQKLEKKEENVKRKKRCNFQTRELSLFFILDANLFFTHLFAMFAKCDAVTFTSKASYKAIKVN